MSRLIAECLYWPTVTTLLLILFIRSSLTDKEVVSSKHSTVGDACFGHHECYRGEVCKKHVCEIITKADNNSDKKKKSKVVKTKSTSSKDYHDDDDDDDYEYGENRAIDPDDFLCTKGEDECQANEVCMVEDEASIDGTCTAIKDCTKSDMECVRCFECNDKTKQCEKLSKGYDECRKEFNRVNEESEESEPETGENSESGSRSRSISKRSSSSESRSREHHGSHDDGCDDILDKIKQGRRNRGWWFCNEGERGVKELKKTLQFKWRCALDHKRELQFCICTGLRDVCTGDFVTHPDYLGFIHARKYCMPGPRGILIVGQGPWRGHDYAIGDEENEVDQHSIIDLLNVTKSEDLDLDEHFDFLYEDTSAVASIEGSSSEDSDGSLEHSDFNQISVGTQDYRGSHSHSHKKKKKKKKSKKKNKSKKKKNIKKCRKEKEIRNKDGWSFCTYEESTLIESSRKVRCFMHKRGNLLPWGSDSPDPSFAYCRNLRWTKCVEDPLNFNLDSQTMMWNRNNLVCLCKCG